jgi:thioredoxin-like negative regulator of GroEL
MILFKDGQQVDKIVGALPKNQLLERLTPHLPAATEESEQVIAL